MKKYDEEPSNQQTESFLLREFELYDDKSNVVHDVFRVRKVNSLDEWAIMKNEEVIVELNKLSVREVKLLKTVQGIQFLLTCAKRGLDSSSKIKKEMKSIL